MRRTIFHLVLLMMIASSLVAQTVVSVDTTNPFLQEWKTPFGVPPFDQIKEEHFIPAYTSAIAQKRSEISAIAEHPDSAIFANTIEALNNAGDLLDKVEAVFNNLNSAETNPKIQEIAKQVSPQLSALNDDILLNARLFSRLKIVWDTRDRVQLAPDQKKLLEETYKRFIRGGANLPMDQQQRLRKINEELALLELKFGENLLKETNAYKLVIEKKKDLAGLPEGVVSAAAAAAKKNSLDGKWLFTLHAPSIWPFLSYAENRDLRKNILTAYAMRGNNGNEQDNKLPATRIAGLRAERAALLGYKTHADFVLEERMAKNPKGVYGLLDQLWSPALKVAKKEASDLQLMINKDRKKFKLEPWDWRFYSEEIKKERYSLDETEVSQYFVLDNVRQGAFYVANRLYGLTFEERTDLPKYHPEVRTFEVKDADGSHLGVYMTDYHPRPGKRGGAWASRYRGQYVKDGKEIRPIVANVCNFTRPTEKTPALLTLEEVETLFHEFGHALHSLLSDIRYKNLAGVPRDFVELPSQIMENWVLQTEVLQIYAKHWQTGKPMPESLIEKIHNAEKFNQGFATLEYLAASYLDMSWHTIGTGTSPDALEFEKASLEKIGLIPEIISRYRTTYFQHIFAGGYSAGYYSYIWSEVLDTDAFSAFKEKGLFDQATALAFRKNILEKGGTEDAMEMYKKFRGREPLVEPLLEKRGLK